MILTDRTMTVNGNTASLDSNVYLYRGDKNVEINFNIVNSKFRFTKKSADNIIESSEAFYSIVKLIAPNGAEIEFPATDIEDGKAKWLIEGELIDELDEVGTYNIQIRLLNNEKDSIITMPPVYGQVEVSEPLFMDDTAITGVSKTTVSKTSFLSSTQRDTLNPDGTYNKKTWKSKELIYESDLNTLEDIASKNRQSIINDEKEIATLKSKTSTLETTTSSHTSTLSTHTTQITNLQNEVGQTSESVEGNYITVSGSKDGSITEIEVLGTTVQDSSNLADIQSVGTLREDGLYEMSILSCGKNLVDKSKCIVGYLTSNGDITLGGASTTTDYIRVEDTYSYKNNLDIEKVSFYDKDKKFINLVSGTSIPTLSLNCKYMRVQFATSKVDINNFQIEEGTQATSYEPYQENKTSILLPCQLEKVGDVSDRLFRREDGVWCVEKNIETEILDGVNCAFSKYSSDGTWFIGTTTHSMSKSNSPLIVTRVKSGNLTTEECVYKGTSGFAIKLLETTIGGSTSPLLNSWLQTNNIVVKYQLATPQIIELPLDVQIQLNSYLGTTHIFTENTVIEPTIKCTIPKSLGASVQSLVNKTDILSDRIEKVETLQEGNELEVSTESSYVVVENTNNGQIEELKIEGKTLVNLTSFKDTQFTLTEGKHYNDILICNLDTISLNKDYTFMYDIEMISNTTTGALGSNMQSIFGVSNGSGDTLAHPTMYINDIETYTIKTLNYRNVFKIRLIDVLSYTTLRLRPLLVPTRPIPAGQSITYKVKNVVLLEGDHTQNPPSYFEGLKSVGDGVDKIEVLSRKEDGDLFDGQLEVGGINANNGEINLTYDRVRSKNFIRVLSKKINISRSVGNNTLYLYEYNGSFKYNLINPKTISTNILNASISLNDDTKYIKIADKSNNINSQIQIRNDYVTTNYESYSQNKKQILIQNSDGVYEKPILRSTGIVSDTIEKHSDGKYYFHKRCNQIVLNGSENINMSSTDYTNTKLFIIEVIGCGLKGDIGAKSDKFISKSPSQWEEDSEGIWYAGVNKIDIRLLKTKLSTQDVRGFKTWLQSNPVTVVYELATEEVYECVNLDLDSYEGETSVIFDGGAISPKITFKIASHIANTVQVLKDRINYLENKVIGMFKAVLSGDVQALAYELYPEDFEKETETIEN